MHLLAEFRSLPRGALAFALARAEKLLGIGPHLGLW